MEIAYRDQPPLLDNSALIGPTHSPVLDAMTTMEERERIEADYEWFRYSKFALPFLIFILLVAVTLFCLTCWWGGTTLKEYHTGMPRIVEIVSTVTDEGGLPEYNRNVRVATFSFGFFGLAGIVLTMYLKPAGGLRKGMYFLFGFLGLFVGGILGAIAGGLDAGKIHNAVWCRSRERGTVSISNNCYSMQKMAIAVTSVELVYASIGILTFFALCYAASQSFQPPKEGDEFAAAPQQRGVSRTTREVLLVLLFLCFACLVLMIVFTILLSEGRDQMQVDEGWNVRRYNNPISGWTEKNTRLRLSNTALVIITVLINLIPFRSRVIAYILAFIYLLASPLLFASFAMDTKDVATARALVCPVGFSCHYAAFVMVCILDIFLAVLLVAYVVFEFIARLLMECRHCARSYGVFEIHKHESNECSSRPVRCEVCSKTMKAKNFVYQHRFECGEEHH